MANAEWRTFVVERVLGQRGVLERDGFALIHQRQQHFGRRLQARQRAADTQLL